MTWFPNRIPRACDDCIGLLQSHNRLLFLAIFATWYLTGGLEGRSANASIALAIMAIVYCPLACWTCFVTLRGCGHEEKREVSNWDLLVSYTDAINNCMLVSLVTTEHANGAVWATGFIKIITITAATATVIKSMLDLNKVTA